MHLPRTPFLCVYSLLPTGAREPPGGGCGPDGRLKSVLLLTGAFLDGSTIHVCCLVVHSAFLPHAREDDKRGESEENRTAAEEQVHAAHRELLQHMQLLPSVLRSEWWGTKAGQHMRRHVEEAQHQLANRMAEVCARSLDEIAHTSTSSPEEMTEDEAAAGEVLRSEEEVTGGDGVFVSLSADRRTPRVVADANALFLLHATAVAWRTCSRSYQPGPNQLIGTTSSPCPPSRRPRRKHFRASHFRDDERHQCR